MRPYALNPVYTCVGGELCGKQIVFPSAEIGENQLRSEGYLLGDSERYGEYFYHKDLSLEERNELIIKHKS